MRKEIHKVQNHVRFVHMRKKTHNITLKELNRRVNKYNRVKIITILVIVIAQILLVKRMFAGLVEKKVQIQTFDQI